MKSSDPVLEHLSYLKLRYFQENLESLTQQAAQEQWTPLQYLGRLLEGEVHVAKTNASRDGFKPPAFR